MLEEDLPEIERVKILLTKDNNDQLSYFFNNIENIFKINKPEFHCLFGYEYDAPKQKNKNARYNYETQSCYGNFLKIKSSIRSTNAKKPTANPPPHQQQVKEILIDDEEEDDTKESDK